MRELKIAYGKANIWQNVLPEWSYPEIRAIESQQDSINFVEKDKKNIAVEIFIPRGGRMLYGALGAEFTSMRTKELILKISVSKEEKLDRDQLLKVTSEQVYIGLPEEFANGVALDIDHSDQLRRFGSGILHFCRAKYGIIGSSPALFGLLGRIILGLLKIDDIYSCPEEDLINVFQLENLRLGYSG